MARRRKETGDSRGSLDSLLDTMTNVVGVLIMVLIVTQVNVSSVAKRIRANLPDVSKSQMEALVAKGRQTSPTCSLFPPPPMNRRHCQERMQ